MVFRKQAWHTGGASAFEGICLYEGVATSREANYKFVTGANNYGCFLFNAYNPQIFIYGIFKDSSITGLETHSNGILKYYTLSNTIRNYRATLNIFEDASFDLTVQFKGGPSISQVVISGTLQLNDQSNSLDNFKIEFNHADYGTYRSYLDDIKVWDGDMSPTPL